MTINANNKKMKDDIVEAKKIADEVVAKVQKVTEEFAQIMERSVEDENGTYAIVGLLRGIEFVADTFLEEAEKLGDKKEDHNFLRSYAALREIIQPS